MSFYVFENLYGEKPHRDETKRNRDVAVNSYTYLIKTSIQNYQKNNPHICYLQVHGLSYIIHVSFY